MVQLLQLVAAVLWVAVIVAALRQLWKSPDGWVKNRWLVLEALTPPLAMVLVVAATTDRLVIDLALVLGLLANLLVWRRQASLLSRAVAAGSAQERLEWLDHLVDSAYEGVYLVDPESMSYVDVNPSGAAALQYRTEQMRNMAISVVHPREDEPVSTAIRQVAESGLRHTISTYATRRDGQESFVEITLSRISRNGRGLVLAVGRDLTRWQVHSQKVERLNRHLILSSQVNRAINREADEAELFQRVCDIAVEYGECQLAWFGWLKDDEVEPVCFSVAGGESVELQSLAVRIGNQSLIPLDRALSSLNVAWENTSRGVGSFPLAQEVQSVAVLPIVRRQEVVAALVLCARVEDTFGDDMRKLLQNLSEDLSRAVQVRYVERQRRLADRQVRLLSSAVEQSADAVSMLDVDGVIQYVNPRFTDLTGYSDTEIVGHSPRMLCYDEEEAAKFDKIFDDLKQGRQWRGELRKRRKSGQEFWCMDTLSPIRDREGAITQYVSTSEDYTALKRAQEKIQELVFYDPLTELPNRRLLLERLRAAVTSTSRDGGVMAVLLLDMDRFKTLNDTLGHHYGDRLLKVAAQRLQGLLRDNDTLARLGGDEFALVLGRLEHSHDAAYVAERVLEVMREPVELDNLEFSGSVSVGVAICPMDGVDAGELLRKADIAMYHAKSQGRDNFQYFTADINRTAVELVALEHRLKHAVRTEQLQPYYQPIWDVRGRVIGVEALARWRDSDGEMVSPAVFIPMAEEVGLMEALGAMILRQACRDIAALQPEPGAAPLFLSVNLSTHQFKRADHLLEVLHQALAESGLDPTRLELEITESMLVQDVDQALSVMERVRALGIRLAIDDFGTGYSSLNYLSRFPVDKLKIDKSFVDDVLESRGKMIASAIIALGSRLGMRVVAEGVESERQMVLLHEEGCEQFQGFLVAPALEIEELKAFLASRELFS